MDVILAFQLDLWFRSGSASPPALGAVVMPAALDLGVWGLNESIASSAHHSGSALVYLLQQREAGLSQKSYKQTSLWAVTHIHRLTIVVRTESPRIFRSHHYENIPFPTASCP